MEQIAQRHTGELVKKMIMELLTSLFAEGLGWKTTKKRSKNRHAPNSVSLPYQETVLWPSGKRRPVHHSKHKTSPCLKCKVKSANVTPRTKIQCHCSKVFWKHWFDVLCETVHSSKPHFYLAWLITSNIGLNPVGWSWGLSMFLWINVMACS